MNVTRAEAVANAVLYEGHILYPYRPSAVKNRQRWTFGAVFPEAYSVAQGGTEAWIMQTECLVRGSRRTTLDVPVLELVHAYGGTPGGCWWSDANRRPSGRRTRS